MCCPRRGRPLSFVQRTFSRMCSCSRVQTVFSFCRKQLITKDSTQALRDFPLRDFLHLHLFTIHTQTHTHTHTHTHTQTHTHTCPWRENIFRRQKTRRFTDTPRYVQFSLVSHVYLSLASSLKKRATSQTHLAGRKLGEESSEEYVPSRCAFSLVRVSLVC